jgi:hypothetical protein
LDQLEKRIHYLDEEIDIANEEVHRNQTILMATIIAISSLFWSLMATIQSSGFQYKSILNVLPFFLAIYFLSLPITSSKLFYITKYRYLKKEDLKNEIDNSKLDLDNFYMLLIIIFSSVAGLFILFSLLYQGDRSWFSFVYTILTLVALIFLLSSIYLIFDPKKGFDISQPQDIDNASIFLKKFAYYGIIVGLLLGLPLLLFAWINDESLSSFTIGFIGFALLGLGRSCLVLYDSTCRDSAIRDGMRDERSTILNEVEKID